MDCGVLLRRRSLPDQQAVHLACQDYRDRPQQKTDEDCREAVPKGVAVMKNATNFDTAIPTLAISAAMMARVLPSADIRVVPSIVRRRR